METAVPRDQNNTRRKTIFDAVLARKESTARRPMVTDRRP
jgi:hypothetical protein